MVTDVVIDCVTPKKTADYGLIMRGVHLKGQIGPNMSLNFCIKKNELLSIAETGGDGKDDVHCYDYRSGFLSSLKGANFGLKKPKDFTID